jgi:uncharacterized protein (TIGR02001 family)
MPAAAISAAILTGGLATAPAVWADFSANIGVTSNYVWRGASQTQNKPAVQGGVDYASDIGIYAGAWASNVDFDSESNAGGEYELDGYFGWGMDFTDNIGLDLGYVYYHYGMLESGSDFGELYGSVSLWWFKLGAAGTVNDQKDSADSKTATFVAGDFAYWGAVSVPMGEAWSIGGTLGQYLFTNDDVTIGNEGRPTDYNYVWWQIDLTRSMAEYGDIALSVSQAEKQADGNDSAKVFIGWTKGF